jgi:DNA-binding MarR family transcriptional regulator
MSTHLAAAPRSVAPLLRGLLAAELVRVEVGTEDARQRVYRLTARGRERLAALRERREGAIAAIWKGFPARELAEFERFSNALSDALERYARERSG